MGGRFEIKYRFHALLKITFGVDDFVLLGDGLLEEDDDEHSEPHASHANRLSPSSRSIEVKDLKRPSRPVSETLLVLLPSSPTLDRSGLGCENLKARSPVAGCGGGGGGGVRAGAVGERIRARRSRGSDEVCDEGATRGAASLSESRSNEVPENEEHRSGRSARGLRAVVPEMVELRTGGRKADEFGADDPPRRTCSQSS